MTENNESNKRVQKLTKLKARRLCAWLVGLVYFISGFLKLADPTGTGLIMTEYFQFLHMDYLIPTSKATGIATSFIEAVTGIALMTGVWRKIIACIVTITQIFYTILTLLLVVRNPTMDCGCFGEAVHLTHWQTFIKNIILIVLLMCSFIPFKKFGVTRKRKYVTFSITVAIITVFTAYSSMNLPLVDHTAFAPSARLMASESGFQPDELYEAVFIYEKEGVRQDFSLEEIPDSTWTFVETKTRMKKQAEDIPVLSLYDENGLNRDTVAAKGKVMLISLYDASVKVRKWERIQTAVQNLRSAGFTPLLVVTEDALGKVPAELTPAYYSDYKTLVTLNRSNGGLTYINDGYIVCKWNGRNYPELERLETMKDKNYIEQSLDTIAWQHVTYQAILLFCILLILFI